MSFRDDHDAALARVAALEAELTRERAEDHTREAHVADLERKLADAEAELATRRPAPAPPPPARRDPLHSATILRWVGVVAVAITIVVGIAMRARKNGDGLDPAMAMSSGPADADALVAEAVSGARQLVVRGGSIEIRAYGVDQHGLLDEDGLVEVVFRDDTRCATFRGRGVGMVRLVPNEPGCRPEPRGLPQAPRCTLRAIWSRALRDGAPAGALARIDTTSGSWTFTIDDVQAPFRASYDDLDCTPS